MADDDSALYAAESRLEVLEQERSKLLAHIKQLRAEQEADVGGSDMSTPPGSPDPASSGVAACATVNRDSPADEKVALFASLSRGRMDVYARRWENRRVGRSGFQPACANEWAAGLCAHETGVLSAGTAFGKTVVAAYLIAERAVNTLVLVHRQQLLDQSVSRLTSFLGLEPKSIGQIGGGKRKPGGLIDVSLLQSLARQGRVDELATDYGQVIVDECHHVPAGTFEQVARAAMARYFVGLSATPTREDGYHPILFMQCGPIRYRSDPRRQAAERRFEHRAVVRPTRFVLPLPGAPEAVSTVGPSIQELYSLLAADQQRNALIVEDVIRAVRAGRSPVVLTERREHLDTLADLLRPEVANVILLHGGLGAKKRWEIVQRLTAIEPSEERVLVATGRYLGEGFDDARLDTLFLALPISWRGTLAQYAGRLHRLDEGKTEVIVYDYAALVTGVVQRAQRGGGRHGNLPTSSQRTGQNGSTPAFGVLWRNAYFAARKASSDAVYHVLNRLCHHS